MKTKLLLSIALSLLIGLGGCHSHQKQSDYCTVKGTVKGLKDGTKLELQDEFQHFKVIATTTVKDGAFEFHPDIAAPTHVYMYTKELEGLSKRYPNGRLFGYCQWDTYYRPLHLCHTIL